MSEEDTSYVVGPADATPPSRWVSGEGYAYYQVQHDGETYTVQEHQLVALLDGADPERLFSGGDWHVHHEAAWSPAFAIGERETEDGFEPIVGEAAARCCRQVNWPANLTVKQATTHSMVSNGDRWGADIDRSAPEEGPSQATRREELRRAVATLENGDGAALEDIMAAAAELGIDRDTAEYELDELRRRGEVYEYRDGLYRAV